jgi:Protein of unknown function (DUF3298).
MKKTLLLSIVTIFVFLFNSCDQTTIRTINKTYTNTVYLSNDTSKGSFTVFVNAELPICFHDKAILNSIYQNLNSQLFGEEFAAISVDSVVNAFADDKIAEYLRVNQPMVSDMTADIDSGLFNFLEIEGFSLLNNEKIYSYGINKNVYLGGKNRVYSTYYHNFDLKTGNRILEKDLFINDYEEDLIEAIKHKLIQQIKLYKPEITSLKETGYIEGKIKPNGNFYITDEGVINYIFNPYEIAPYSYGQTEISLTFAELSNILKNRSILTR